MTKRPNLRDLIGDEVEGRELERLERVHDLLLAAGPPPELSPAITRVAPPRRTVFERRRWAVLALAATMVAAAFLGGTVFGQERADFDAVRTVDMRGLASVRGAVGSLQIGKRDAHGNWPMIFKVRGLQKLGPRGYYELLLTQDGRLVPCGSFNAREGTTTVQFNAPYELSESSRWVVTMHRNGHVDNPPVVMTT